MTRRMRKAVRLFLAIPLLAIGCSLVVWSLISYWRCHTIVRQHPPRLVIDSNCGLLECSYHHDLDGEGRWPLMLEFKSSRSETRYRPNRLKWERFSYHSAISAPHAAIAIVAFAIGGVLWWPRRFGLRQALLATTIAALLFALLGVALRPYGVIGDITPLLSRTTAVDPARTGR
jgi:hypothetical protein